ncbi:MAG: 50S ribosomal protein L25 [Desulfurivibrionaceae bacterium]|nr:50S ribosomal protein L25 [Desulfobulbales bacterium]MDT8334846.1 50S ribosomal protein L25 [Desulfurivibrionaceae bacterium]
MLQLEINADIRTTHGKGAARVLRSKGLTPAVLYGAKSAPVSLELETKTFSKTLLGINRRNALINLGIGEGEKKSTRHVIIKELQTDPLKDGLLHADFCEVSLEEPMVLSVHIELRGKAKGVDLGGILQLGMDRVRMRGKILDFPDSLPVDISGLAIEDGISLNDIDIPANLEVLGDENSMVVFIADPTKVKAVGEEEAEEAEVAAAETGEPEAETGTEATK